MQLGLSDFLLDGLEVGAVAGIGLGTLLLCQFTVEVGTHLLRIDALVAKEVL